MISAPQGSQRICTFFCKSSVKKRDNNPQKGESKRGEGLSNQYPILHRIPKDTHDLIFTGAVLEPSDAIEHLMHNVHTSGCKCGYDLAYGVYVKTRIGKVLMRIHSSATNKCKQVITPPLQWH